RRLTAAYLRRLPECLQGCAGRVLPGVAELLDRLRDRGDVLVGLLTGNVRDGARVKLGHFGLHEHFTIGGLGAHHFDPDPVAALGDHGWPRGVVAGGALAAVGRVLTGAAAPARVWVAGGTPLDVRCARAIGARAAAVCTGWHGRDQLAACEPDLLLTDLADP